MDEAELIALRMGLKECNRLGFSNISVEGNSQFVIHWALCSSKPPWHLADVVKGVKEIASITFTNDLHRANVAVDLLAKEGVRT